LLCLVLISAEMPNVITGFSLWFFSEPPDDFPDKAVKYIHSRVLPVPYILYVLTDQVFFSIYYLHFIPIGAVAVL